MKAFNLVTLILVIIGGINWGLVGLFDYDLVSLLFGYGNGFTKLLFTVVGIAAVYQLVPFSRAIDIGEIRAEGGKY